MQKDRPLISGVIDNRLADGMTLGIDATLLYDDPTPDGELSTSDIETDSPYNTRIRTGSAAHADRQSRTSGRSRRRWSPPTRRTSTTCCAATTAATDSPSRTTSILRERR